jgi:hypoxanthine phosphoribosyltransferase
MKIDHISVQNVLAKADQIYTELQVSQAIDAMAETITHRLHDTHPVCLSVMLGGLVLTGQLIPRLNFPLELDYIHATRYLGATEGGELHWLKYPTISLRDRTVVIIDDILDEGLTLHAIVEYCRQMGAKQVFSAVLVEKQRVRDKVNIQADFAGLLVPDRYVFGYGMDYQDQLRYAAGIYAVHGL